jgi:hypothetical protein
MRSKLTVPALATAFALVAWATSGHASNLASDNAADPAYSGGIANQNGGTGFSNWVEVAQDGPAGSGSFIGDATQNGYIPSGGAINTSGKSWGLYGNSGNTEVLYRNFTGGSLSIGQSFDIGMDNGYVNSDGGVDGFVLRNGTDTSSKNNGQRFEFLFIGGDADYYIATNSTSPLVDTGVSYTDGGLLLDFTLTGADSYSLSITGLTSGASAIVSGVLGGTPSSGIDSVALYNQNAGSGGNYDLYFNQMAIVPEPSTVALVTVGLLGAFVVRRRK